MSVAHRTATVQELVPLLFVEDIECSLAFYRDQLGFEMTEKWEPEGRIAWCRLVRGGAAVMLQQACEEDGPAAGRGRGIGFFFLCDDADAIHIELCAKGLLLDPPTVAFYGMKQLFFKDPDGYELCFQNKVAKNSPVRDAWCSFCRKHYHEVGPMVESPDHVYICYWCSVRCTDAIEKDSKRHGPPS